MSGVPETVPTKQKVEGDCQKLVRECASLRALSIGRNRFDFGVTFSESVMTSLKLWGCWDLNFVFMIMQQAPLTPGCATEVRLPEPTC